MKKRKSSDDFLSSKRAKRALARARREPARRAALTAKAAAHRAARQAEFEELKAQLMKNWEKQFNG